MLKYGKLASDVITSGTTDNGSDKEWLAIGPDPAQPKRDNLYITWTSFQATGAQLWLAKSIDGGATWTTQLLFAPTNSGAFSNSLQFSNPVVDPSNGRLYVPFLHFTQALDADGVRVLASDDGGATFNFLAFNSPDAPDTTSYMVVTPGEFVDCGRNNGGFRPVLHQGSDDGGGRFGLARYVHATRLVTQPSAAALRGRLFIAVQASTSPLFGDPTGGSEIRLLYSPDGGNHWAAPLTVAPSTAKEPQHVHPSIAIDQDGNRAFVGYYVQQADTKLRTDLVSVRVDGKKLRLGRARALSTADFDLTPSNNPFPLATNPNFTTNYDRTIAACYDIGEYMSVASSNRDDCSVVAAWGDNRRLWTSPPDSPAAGEHAQADVFVTPKEE